MPIDIEQNAQGPESVETDGTRIKQHSLRDQIAADRYLANRNALSRGPSKSVVIVKIVPPGIT